MKENLEERINRRVKEEGLYRKKMASLPAMIIGGLAILSLIIGMFISDTDVLPAWGTFVYIGFMFLMVLSILWPGIPFADYMLKRKKKRIQDQVGNYGGRTAEQVLKKSDRITFGIDSN